MSSTIFKLDIIISKTNKYFLLSFDSISKNVFFVLLDELSIHINTTLITFGTFTQPFRNKCVLFKILLIDSRYKESIFTN